MVLGGGVSQDNMPLAEEVGGTCLTNHWWAVGGCMCDLWGVCPRTCLWRAVERGCGLGVWYVGSGQHAFGGL